MRKQGEHAQTIAIEKLVPFRSHPFVVRDDEQMQVLTDSMLDQLTAEMAQREGVTEALKASDQMEWVRRMNGIRARAEEAVYAEVIYAM